MSTSELINRVHAIGGTIEGHHSRPTTDERLCQDAHLIQSGSVAGQHYVAICVADGHGGAAHDLSHVGSALAVRDAVNVFVDLLWGEAQDDHVNPSDVAASFKATFARKLVQAWGSRVEKDSARRLPRELRGDLKMVFNRYGSTMLFAGCINDTLLLAQLGDGDICLIHNNQLAEPIGCQSKLHVAGATDSLCSLNSDSIRITTRSLRSELHDQISACFLSTDGLGNALNSESALNDLFASIIGEVRTHGVNPVSRLLPEYMRRASDGGSGDDVTLCALIWDDATPDNQSTAVETDCISQENSDCIHDAPEAASALHKNVTELPKGHDYGNQEDSPYINDRADQTTPGHSTEAR